MRIFSDCVEVEIISAEPAITLRSLNECGITLRTVRYIDDLTVLVVLDMHQFTGAERIITGKGAKIRIVKYFGVRRSILNFLKRPVMLIAIAMIVALTLFLPTRILFVKIQGNTSLSDNLITEKASQCGISFGASRRSVRSEKVKNRLLKELPDLRWIGVNTTGCTAVITVQEKASPRLEQGRSGISHIVSSKDAIITDITVYRGLPICGVGEAVCKGERLVSGYVDHGLLVEGTHADAEIWGYTGNVLHAVVLRNGRYKTDRIDTKRYYSLLLGKKLINFGKDSGISGAGCDRMYSESYFVLPGGFRLPVALICEEISYCSTDVHCRTVENDSSWLTNSTRSYLQNHMLSGEILSENTRVVTDKDLIRFYGTYRCHEMIGKIQSEENMFTDGQRN